MEGEENGEQRRGKSEKGGKEEANSERKEIEQETE